MPSVLLERLLLVMFFCFESFINKKVGQDMYEKLSRFASALRLSANYVCTPCSRSAFRKGPGEYTPQNHSFR